jgi:NAD(P)-dependent dehydrogenase (short-subunit alcohol dehydrogenase family)
MDVTDSICVVTGGASGIGAALAARFVAEGAKSVVIADLRAGPTAATAADIGAVGIQCDVTDEGQVAALVERVEDQHGPIDLFCSNAGFSIDGGLEVPDDGWALLWDLHVMAHVYAARAVLPSMRAAGGGYLLQTVSAAGLLASLTSLPYTVTKHASLAFAEWLAITERENGIRVSALCPLVVDTPLTERFELDRSSGDLATVQQVADAVMAGIRDESFLILPHPEVSAYVERKAMDEDRWLAGMSRLWGSVRP